MIGIYKIINQVNQKIYVGQSNDIKRRWSEHKRCYKTKNTKLYQAMREFGIENFSFEIIEIFEEYNQNKLNERENFWIKNYNALEDGYNMSTIENLQKRFSKQEVYEIQKEIMDISNSYKELERKYNVSDSWLSQVNQGKMWFNAELNYPLRPIIKNEKISRNCIDCGKPITKGAKRCVVCSHKAARTVKRPDRETLKNLIRTQPFTTIAITYGVSDKAVGKWCKFENLPFKKREINNYSDEEWKLI